MRPPRMGFGIALAATFTACSATELTEPATRTTRAPAPTASVATTGNGFPSGPHYNLNIIGVSNPKSADFSGGNGGRIFVSLTGRTNISLSQGDFAVLDANGTDGQASFRLPAADPTNSGTTTYSVYARALGTPGGSATIQTCATDPTTGEVVCSTLNSVQVRNTGKSTATNVSKELLYIYTDVVTGTMTRYPIFDAALQNYFWQYDNFGLKVLQLRFYQLPTTVQ